MAVNRFFKRNAFNQFNPVSFEQYAAVPLALQQAHDNVISSALSNKVDVSANADDEAKRDLYQKELDDSIYNIVDQINEKGFTQEFVGNTLTLKRRHDELMSQNGDLGKIQRSFDLREKYKEALMKNNAITGDIRRNSLALADSRYEGYEKGLYQEYTPTDHVDILKEANAYMSQLDPKVLGWEGNYTYDPTTNLFVSNTGQTRKLTSDELRTVTTNLLNNSKYQDFLTQEYTFDKLNNPEKYADLTDVQGYDVFSKEQVSKIAKSMGEIHRIDDKKTGRKVISGGNKGSGGPTLDEIARGVAKTDRSGNAYQKGFNIDEKAIPTHMYTMKGRDGDRVTFASAEGLYNAFLENKLSDEEEVQLAVFAKFATANSKFTSFLSSDKEMERAYDEVSKTYSNTTKLDDNLRGVLNDYFSNPTKYRALDEAIKKRTTAGNDGSWDVLDKIFSLDSGADAALNNENNLFTYENIDPYTREKIIKEQYKSHVNGYEEYVSTAASLGMTEPLPFLDYLESIDNIDEDKNNSGELNVPTKVYTQIPTDTKEARQLLDNPNHLNNEVIYVSSDGAKAEPMQGEDAIDYINGLKKKGYVTGDISVIRENGYTGSGGYRLTLNPSKDSNLSANERKVVQIEIEGSDDLKRVHEPLSFYTNFKFEGSFVEGPEYVPTIGYLNTDIYTSTVSENSNIPNSTPVPMKLIPVKFPGGEIKYKVYTFNSESQNFEQSYKGEQPVIFSEQQGDRIINNHTDREMTRYYMNLGMGAEVLKAITNSKVSEN